MANIKDKYGINTKYHTICEIMKELRANVSNNTKAA